MGNKTPADSYHKDRVNVCADTLLTSIRAVIAQARQQVKQTVNHAMVQTYWQIGKLIVEDEQQGNARAIYGKAQLKQLSTQLRQWVNQPA